MKKNNLYKYLTASFAMLIPVPGRLAYGIVLILLFNFLMLFGTLFRKLVSILKIQDFQNVLISLLLVSVSVLFKQFLIMFNPTMAMVLGFNIYMPAVCSFMIGSLYRESDVSLVADLKYNMIRSGLFSAFAFFFFLFRDILGYGTITFPGVSSIHPVVLFGRNKPFIIGNFFASIPGSLVSVALFFVIGSIILSKASKEKKSGGER